VGFLSTLGDQFQQHAPSTWQSVLTKAALVVLAAVVGAVTAPLTDRTPLEGAVAIGRIVLIIVVLQLLIGGVVALFRGRTRDR
jgi:heme A synthase